MLGGKTATGCRFPTTSCEALGAGKRPPVVVTVGGYTYRTTVAPMGGAFWIPLAAEHREPRGGGGGGRRRVELDTAPREGRCPTTWPPPSTTPPQPLPSSPSHRKEWVRWVEEAKKPETRAARIEKTAESLRAGKKAR